MFAALADDDSTSVKGKRAAEAGPGPTAQPINASLADHSLCLSPDPFLTVSSTHSGVPRLVT